jgi:pimeloyl-ACP methyl ester carboxylesterase
MAADESASQAGTTAGKSLHRDAGVAPTTKQSRSWTHIDPMLRRKPSIGKRIVLGDWRLLWYAEYGEPDGKPVFLFPGTPSSRLLHPPEEPTKSAGARLIVVERPGFGMSDFQPHRTLLDWPDDVLELTNWLEIDRFAVVGLSAGGPYAAACAYKIPHRLTGVAIVSGVGPADVPGSLAEMPRIRRVGALVARHAPRLLTPLLWLFGNPRRNPERFFERMCAQMSDVDRAVLARPGVRDMLMKSYREATQAGLRGFARDSVILSTPWDFRLQDICVRVHLWHGEKDTNVSLSAARYMAQAIPKCEATFLPDEGHWLFLDHWQEILAPLMDDRAWRHLLWK